MSIALIMNKIGTPETSHMVKNESEYREWTLINAVNMYGYKPVLDERGKPALKKGGTRAAYISDGRWVCLCRCGNGCAAHPEWNLACCVECGIEYKLHLPKSEDRERAEALLLERDHPRNRHWFPHKSVATKFGLNDAETTLTLLSENQVYLIK